MPRRAALKREILYQPFAHQEMDIAVRTISDEKLMQAFREMPGIPSPTQRRQRAFRRAFQRRVDEMLERSGSSAQQHRLQTTVRGNCNMPALVMIIAGALIVVLHGMVKILGRRT